MKHLKLFENEGDTILFSVGDTVYCIYTGIAKIGTKFKVDRIYTYQSGRYHDSVKNLKVLKESEHNKNYFLDITNLETDEHYQGIWSTRFTSEFEYNIIKYNL